MNCKGYNGDATIACAGTPCNSPIEDLRSTQTEFWTYLSAILFLGLIANGLLERLWADSAAAFVGVPFIVREGISSIRAKHC
jgi:hypothetical protein